MPRILLLFFFWVFFFSSRASVFAGEEECSRLLSAPVKVVEIDLSRPVKVIETSTMTIRALQAVTAPFKLDDSRRGFNVGFAIMSTLLFKLHKQFAVEFERDPKLKEEFDQFNRSGDPAEYNFEKVFNQPKSPDLYSRFVSAMQKYFSTVMIGYAFVRADLGPEQRLNVLDLGVGVGDTAYAIRKFFPRSMIVGVDKSSHLLDRFLREYRGLIRGKQGDFGVTPLDFEANQFDLVTSICAANQYLPYDQFELLLKDVLRLLKPGGYFLFEYGPWNHERFGASGPRNFLKALKDLGYKTEPLVRFGLKVGGHTYFPILVRKPRPLRVLKIGATLLK